MSSMLEPDAGKLDFLGVSEGKIVKRVDKDTPGAIPRNIKDKDGTDTGRVVYEIKFRALRGVVKNIKHRLFEKDGLKFESLHVYVANGPETVVLSVPFDSSYTRHLLNKLPMVDLTEEVRLAPYDFKKNDKRYYGFTIEQDGQKVEHGFFFDYVDDKRVYKYGYPVIDFDVATADSDDWKGYAIKERKFLKRAIEEIIRPMLPVDHSIEDNDLVSGQMMDPIDPTPSDDLPF